MYLSVFVTENRVVEGIIALLGRRNKIQRDRHNYSSFCPEKKLINCAFSL